MRICEGFDMNEERKTKDIIEAFDKYTSGMKNITYERYIFNIRNQNQEESIGEFVTDLRRIKKNCDICKTCGYGILRDKIILGI